MDGILSDNFITTMRQTIMKRIINIYYFICCMLVITALIVAWVITICLYLSLYMVIVPIYAIKCLFTNRK
jgi:hypothetical protein